MASPNLQGALKDGFGEAVVACDMPEPGKFPSLDSCQKRFPWTHKEVHLAPYPVVGLMLQVGDTEKFPHARFTAVEEDGGDRRLVELELACKADGVAPPDPVCLAIATIAEAILIRTSAEQVPSLHRVTPRYLKLVTSSNFWQFMLISALILFVLLVMILLFSVLTSIPYAVTLSTSLLVRS